MTDSAECGSSPAVRMSWIIEADSGRCCGFMFVLRQVEKTESCSKDQTLGLSLRRGLKCVILG